MYQKQLKRIRLIINALMIAALLAGLIPPPIVTHVVDMTGLPDLTGFQNLTGLDGTTANAAPVETLISAAAIIAADDFSSNSTSGGTGWLAPWSEDAFPDAVDFTGGVLRLGDANANNEALASRTVDLAACTAATLTFNWSCSGGWETDDFLTVYASQGGGGYSQLFQRPGGGSNICGAGSGTESIALPAGNANTSIRFGLLTSTDAEFFNIDNVQVDCTASTSNQISGTVFRDYDADAMNDATDPGIENIRVTAFDANGNSTFTDTDASGVYTLTAASGTPSALSGELRIEFTLPTDGSLDFLEPTIAGTGSTTSVQFANIDVGATVDAGFYNPADYCQSDPQLITSCYVSGDPLANSADMTTDDALVRFANSASGIGIPGTNEFQVATVGEIGATWGMAYDRNNDRVFVSELIKRHVGLIENETGGVIYEIANPTAATPAVSVYLDFVTDLNIPVVDTSGPYTGAMPSNSARGLQANKVDPSVDLQGFELVGKASFGDMDISADGRTLYIVNLGDRRVYHIDLAQADAGTKNATALPAFPDPGCTDGVARPWALEIHDGLVHVGVICSAENSTDSANLSAHVYAYDPTAGSWNSTALIDVTTLDFQRRDIFNPPWIVIEHDATFNPWTDDYNDFYSDGVSYHPQPILADIEFDYEGSMHLAFLDRAGHQLGHRNLTPIGNDTITGVTGGDIMRTYYDASTGQHVLEANATAGIYSSAGMNGGDGNCDASNNCGEFYFDDNVTAFGGSNYHAETHSGGLAHILGTTQLSAITMDPIDDRLDAQGVQWYDITNGSETQEFEIFQSINTADLFSKSNGLGDLELLCAAAPIEIGNRVWWDPDRNGIQDGSPAALTINDDQPIDGVTVKLYLDPDGNTQGNNPANGDEVLLVSTTTANGGQYYFSYEGDPTKDNANGFADQDWSAATGAGQPIAVQPNTTYQVRIEGYATAGQAYDQIVAGVTGLNNGDTVGLSVSNNGGGDAGSDLRDTDVYDNPGDAAIAVQTGATGANSHTFDFAFSSAGYDLALIKTVAAQSDTPLTIGSTVTFTIQVLNQGGLDAVNPQIVDYVPAGLTVADANWSNDGSTGPVNATRTLNGTIASGAITTTQIMMTVASIPASRIITNTAEIAADDGNDIDSTPDTTDSDAVVDNAFLDDATNNVDNDGDTIVDEDDHDIAPVYLCDAGTGDLGGTIFRDYNSDGTQDSGEVGFTNGTVTAYGNDDNVGVTVAINPDGTYVFPDLFDTNTHIRLEFDSLPAYMQPSFSGTTPGSAVMTQRHAAATCEADLAVNNPADYCQANPDIAVACFENGTGVTNANPGLVSFNYTDDGVPQGYANGAGAEPLPSVDAPISEVGAVWGAAYQRNEQWLYVSSLMKRHVGFIDNPGHVYIFNYSTPTVTRAGSFDLSGVTPDSGPVIDLGSVCRRDGRDGDPNDTCNPLGTGFASDYTLPASPTTPNIDLDAFGQVGKVSYGDIDLTEDGDTLWLVNLNQRSLIDVNVTSGVAGQLGAVNHTLLGTLGVTRTDGSSTTFDSLCAGKGVMRPWAMKFKDGLGYLGAVCDASITDLASDLAAYVFTFDPANVGGGLQEQVSVPLNYAREPGWNDSPDSLWQPWADTWAELQPYTLAPDNNYMAPQPILADIEVNEDGSLVLGFMDRFGHQSGRSNRPPFSQTTDLVDTNALGDLLHICRSNGAYIPEGSSGCPVFDTSNVFNTRTNDGLAGTGEFYFQDYYFFQTVDLREVNHGETGSGALALQLGRNEVIATHFDPVLSSNEYSGIQLINMQGVIWHSTQTGQRALASNTTDHAYVIVDATNSIDEGFGKANGLGDLELLCDAAPIELGNYVWLDADGDGVQDPCEEPIPGVQVSLYDITGTLVATTTTDASGEYYFSDASVGNQTWLVGSSLTPSTTYEIEIDLNQTVTVSGTQYLLSDLVPSPTGGTGGSQAFNDEHDSDGVLNGGTVETTAVTGAAGHNDHSFDFGFVPTGTPMIQVDKQFNGVGDYRVGETISFTIRITNTGDVVIDTLPLEDRFSRAFLQYQSATPQPTPSTVTGGTIIWPDVLASLSDPDGLGVGESVSVDVYFTTAADTSLLPAVAPCSSSGHTPNLARSVGATSSAGTVVEDGDDTSCDHVQILNPTAVQLAERSMSQMSDGVLVHWSTVSENDIIGFYIWQSNGVDAEVRSGEMIVASYAGQSSGASYQWMDIGAILTQGDTYVLEVVHNDGSTQRTVIDVMSGEAIFLPVVVR